MSEKNIQIEIQDTIIYLCKTIQQVEYPPLEKAELVKATAQLIDVAKGYIF
jgi:hypothetical protein